MERDGGQLIRRDPTTPVDLAGIGLGVMIGDVPTGGPYTIRVAPADQPTAPARQFFHILVGDIWLLGGQSNMYGIDVVKEDLPVLPWLNMPNVRHIDLAVHCCPALPLIHRIPETLAAFTLKSQYPDDPDETIRAMIASGNLLAESIARTSLFASFMRRVVSDWVHTLAMGGSRRSGTRVRRARATTCRAPRQRTPVAGSRAWFFQGEQHAIFGDGRGPEENRRKSYS